MSSLTASNADHVLQDVRPVLGVPFTNLIFHKLAAWPDFLSRAWAWTRPVVLTREFQACADELARIAVPPVTTPAFLWPASVSAEDRRRIRLLTDAYVRVQPQLLLVVAGWSQLLAGSGNSASIAQPAPSPNTEWQRRSAPGIGDPEANVPLIDLPPRDPGFEQLFDEMIVARDHPGVASYYRSLAQWPNVLQALWLLLRPCIDSAHYGEQTRSLITTAERGAANLGFARAGVTFAETDHHRIAQVLNAWRDVQVPQLMLDTAILRRALE